MSAKESKPKIPLKVSTRAKRRVGRPKGSFSEQTLEKLHINKAINQRILRKADRIHNSQYHLAVGCYSVFRIEENPTNHAKSYHLVTDDEEIKALLDEHQGESGAVGDTYYVIEKVKADNKAIDSMFDRVFGKPSTTAEIEQSKENKQHIARLFAMFFQALKRPNATPKEQLAEAVQGYCRLKGLDVHDMALAIQDEVLQLESVN